MCISMLEKYKQDETLFSECLFLTLMHHYQNHTMTLMCLFIISPSLSFQHKTMSSQKKPLSICPSFSLLFPFLATLHPIMFSYSLHLHLLSKSSQEFYNTDLHMIIIPSWKESTSTLSPIWTYTVISIH